MLPPRPRRVNARSAFQCITESTRGQADIEFRGDGDRAKVQTIPQLPRVNRALRAFLRADHDAVPGASPPDRPPASAQVASTVYRGDPGDGCTEVKDS